MNGSTVPDILARIVSRKRAELHTLRSNAAEWERRASVLQAGNRDFRAAIAGRSPAIIAEIKKASPSKGLLTNSFDPVGMARQYEAAGAAAISVLTDEPDFQGSLDDLVRARKAVRLPVLRKDFTIDPIHVIQAAAHGADAILLIAAILDAPDIRELRLLAAGFGLASLVEVHDESELDVALAAGAGIVGVNNRNLHTFEVTLETSLRLAARIPKGIIRVSESGIHSHDDVERLTDAGYQAFLVGERLMKSTDVAADLRSLAGTS
ncbi:MAG: indole-3-glycerol phosphate synthase TrpC [Bryobacteraceae bacterium]